MANPSAKPDRGVGVWANFWSGDRGTAVTRTGLSRGPWIKALESLTLFRQK